MKLLQRQILRADKRLDFTEIPDFLKIPITGKQPKKQKKTFAGYMEDRGYKEFDWAYKDYDKPWLEGLTP